MCAFVLWWLILELIQKKKKSLDYKESKPGITGSSVGETFVVIQSTQYKRLQVAPEKRCLCGEILDKRAGFKYTLIKKESNLGQRKNTLRSLS